MRTRDERWVICTARLSEGAAERIGVFRRDPFDEVNERGLSAAAVRSIAKCVDHQVDDKLFTAVVGGVLEGACVRT